MALVSEALCKSKQPIIAYHLSLSRRCLTDNSSSPSSIGLIVGFAFSSILLSVVGSAVNTVIVCYAEAPREFEINHPQLSSEMRAAWMQAWPGLTIG